jgi:hypothetical protein
MAMHGWATTAILEAYDFSGLQVLADIGGGNGSAIAAILKKYPDMRGILFDLPGVAERAKQNIQAAGVADRCQVIGGSFMEAVPTGGRCTGPTALPCTPFSSHQCSTDANPLAELLSAWLQWAFLPLLVP